MERKTGKSAFWGSAYPLISPFTGRFVRIKNFSSTTIRVLHAYATLSKIDPNVIGQGYGAKNQENWHFGVRCAFSFLPLPVYSLAEELALIAIGVVCVTHQKL